MAVMTVPVDAMWSVTDLSRGGVSKALDQVADGHPVTVLRNNRPAGYILSPQDYQRIGDMEDELRELRNAEARRQVRDREYGPSFDNVDDLMGYLNAL